MSRSSAAGDKREKPPTAAPRAGAGIGGTYLERSHRPLTSLAFVLPLLLFYEVSMGLWGVLPIDHPPPAVIAFRLMQRFFALFGATGRYLPALALVGLLLSWHIRDKDPWRVRLPHLAGMAFESLLLAIPLVALGSFLAWALPQTMMAGAELPDRGLVVISVGAGVYEEMVFRLMLFTFVSLLLHDLLGMGRKRTAAVVLVGSAVLFALYHYLGTETFDAPTFAFRTAAGLYFGALFFSRGFGITAGSHTAYDLFFAFGLL